MRVVCIHETIAIRVLRGERSEAIGSEVTWGDLSAVAKEFAAAVDRAVTVAVVDEEAIVAADPARAGGKRRRHHDRTGWDWRH